MVQQTSDSHPTCCALTKDGLPCSHRAVVHGMCLTHYKMYRWGGWTQRQKK